MSIALAEKNTSILPLKRRLALTSLGMTFLFNIKNKLFKCPIRSKASRSLHFRVFNHSHYHLRWTSWRLKSKFNTLEEHFKGLCATWQKKNISRLLLHYNRDHFRKCFTKTSTNKNLSNIYYIVSLHHFPKNMTCRQCCIENVLKNCLRLVEALQ